MVGRARGSGGPVGTLTRYDLYLATLPLLLVTGTVAAVVSTLPTPACVAAGGVPAALLVGYGLFVDTPVPERGIDGRGGVGPADD
jgi:hypothetical protein